MLQGKFMLSVQNEESSEHSNTYAKYTKMLHALSLKR